MKGSLLCLRRAYSIVLRLYPARFRNEFGEEMEGVLEEALGDVGRNGRRALYSLLVRELWDLSGMLLRLHWENQKERQKELTMSAVIENSPEINPEGAPRQTEESVTWAQTVAAMMPFLIIPISIAIGSGLDLVFRSIGPSESNWNLIVSYVVWTIMGGVTFGLAVSWKKGFPRWSIPLWSLAFLLSLYLMNATTPGLVFFNYTFGRGEQWGWRTLIPMFLAIVVGILWSRSLQPPIQLVRRAWRDWTLVSFALYAWVVLAVFIFLDEIRGDEVFLGALSALLALGALGYMRSVKTERRMLSLLACLSVVWAAATIYKAVYWSEPSLYAMPWVDPVPRDETVTEMIQSGLIIAAFLCSPLIIGLTRRAMTLSKSP